MKPRTFEERRPIGVSVEELKRTLDAVETLAPAHLIAIRASSF